MRPLNALGTAVADLLSLPSLEGRELARDVVFATLRREYPCEAGEE